MSPEEYWGPREISVVDDYDVSYLFQVKPQPDWSEGGAICLQVGPGPWISEDMAEQAQAAKICATCPMQKACLDWSLDPANDVTWGTWGGLNHLERAAGLREPGEGFVPVPGVAWNDVRRRWVAQLPATKNNDSGRYVGTFKDYGEAVQALRAATARLDDNDKKGETA